LLRSSTVHAIHYFARSLLLAGFAFLIVHLVRSDNLGLYIAERMQFIVKLSALGLYAVAAQQFYSAIRALFDKDEHGPSCDCSHELPSTWGKSLLLYGWFALPLIIGYAVPDGLLGSSMAAAKGVQFAPQQQFVRADPLPAPANTSAPAADEESKMPETAKPETGTETEDSSTKPPSAKDGKLSPEALDILFPFDNFTESYAAFGRKLVERDVIAVTAGRFIETLTTLDLYRTAFQGKTVRLSGFVYREPDMSPTQFGVSRFAVACCSADASPYGIMATLPDANLYATDQWVTVTGTLSTTEYNGIEIIQLNVSRIVKIDAPATPYVSPDLDFGLEQLDAGDEEA
jgi:uncharacterized repeat protein (TIGR03943 family)